MPSSSTSPETAKERSLRVPLDHYRQPDRLLRLKFWLSLAAGGLAIAYVAWLLVDSRSGGRHASPGAVASVHAAWNDDCRRCHLDFRPLDASAADLAALGGKSSAAAHRELVDRKCQECHPAQSALHQPNQKPDDVPTCAACHTEHRGVSADIARPQDALCTQCHSQLANHRTSKSLANLQDVSRFAALPEHPAFRSLARDPGQAKFNHWLHLQPGLAAPGDKPSAQLTRQSLSAQGQKQYSRTAAGGLVQLDCNDCHEPDSAGRYMRPIAYEQHCRACHPLEIKLAEGKSLGTLPHGLPAKQMGAALDGLLLAAAPKTPAVGDRADESGALPLIPGNTLGQNLAQKLGQDVSLQREKATIAVAARCRHCHEVNPSEDLLSVAATDIPSRWFQFAEFDHRAHQNVVQCATCHEKASSASGARGTKDGDVVMIPGQETCIKCHAPVVRGATAARFDCAECHRYHSQHAPANRAAIDSPRLSLISFQPPPSASTSQLDRIVSCAAAGCHGDARPGAPAWRSSLATWLAADPHSQAYNVLWTARGREMARRLARSDAPLADAAHTQLLAERCSACHGGGGGIEEISLGIHCESCHGPADSWLASHYSQKFSRRSPGFIDTKDLQQRAKSCVPCHVGPAGDSKQTVDHDLIAAGHPRLNFELHSYLESLPAHWDQSREGKSHFAVWSAGQAQLATQQRTLAAYFQEQNARLPGEFALLDCAACHQSLRPDKWQASGAIRGPSILTQREPLWQRLKTPTPSQLVDAAAQPNCNFDDAVACYLGLRAFAADLPNDQLQLSGLAAALDALGRYLGRECFAPDRAGSTPPTPYDSPQRYDPAALARYLPAVRVALAKLPP